MAQIRVGVIDPAENQPIIVEVPDDVMVRDLREALVEQLGLPTRDRNGQPLRYHLNIRKDDGTLERLEDKSTLEENNIQEGGVLQLNVEMVAGCFLPGTRVTLSDGKQIRIENLKVGDKVLSYDTGKKEFCDGIVSDIFVGESNEYLILNDKLRVTGSHPIYSNNQWIQAKSLTEGDLLYTEDRISFPIRSIKTQQIRTAIYNLHLDTITHTFFAESILVHNMALKAAMALEDMNTASHSFMSPAAPEKISHDVLRISISLSTLITLNDLFDGVTDRMQAIDFIYSVYSLLASSDPDVIHNFIRTIKQQETLIPSNTYVHRFMTIANVEPLRIQSFHYGSPATFDLLGVGNVLELVRDTIKDLAWKGQHEKSMAELELRTKQLDIEKGKLDANNASISRKLEMEKAALEMESQRIAIEKANTELLSQKIDLLNKISNLQISDDDKKVIVSILLPKALTISDNPVAPILKTATDPYEILFKPKA